MRDVLIFGQLNIPIFVSIFPMLLNWNLKKCYECTYSRLIICVINDEENNTIEKQPFKNVGENSVRMLAA